MAFSFPTIKEFLKILSIDHTYSMQPTQQVNEKFYYRPSTTEEYNCAVIYEDDSFTA
ncbi:AAA family ATPase, partial [Bacillus wiedmannii]